MCSEGGWEIVYFSFFIYVCISKFPNEPMHLPLCWICVESWLAFRAAVLPKFWWPTCRSVTRQWFRNHEWLTCEHVETESRDGPETVGRSMVSRWAAQVRFDRMRGLWTRTSQLRGAAEYFNKRRHMFTMHALYVFVCYILIILFIDVYLEYVCHVCFLHYKV